MIIAITGKDRAGKTSVAKALGEVLFYGGWRVCYFSFADRLRHDMVNGAVTLSDGTILGDMFKEFKKDNPSYSYHYRNVLWEFFEALKNEGRPIREAMIDYAENPETGMKALFGDDVYANELESYLLHRSLGGDKQQIVIIDDMRFTVEVDSVLAANEAFDMGGVLRVILEDDTSRYEIDELKSLDSHILYLGTLGHKTPQSLAWRIGNAVDTIMEEAQDD